MNYDVTRDVVSDLWPLCRANEASQDSRRLVDVFLAGDGAFAEQLQRSAELTGAMPALKLSPNAEREMLDQARERARWKLMVVGGGIGLAGLIFLVALIGAMFLTFRSGGLGG